MNKLKSEYKNLHINENVDKAKKEAAAGKYGEAIRYLDLALTVDPNAEQPVKLKDEYNKAIQEEKIIKSAKAIQEEKNVKSANSSTNKPKAGSSDNSSNVQKSKAVQPVRGVDAIKKAFKKLGFVFDSDTTAIYDKNDIKIGLVNRGDYWQLATKTWGSKVDSLFWDCMTIILGSERAFDNLIYIDYALEMPGTTHKSSNVTTFVNDDKLVVYVYVPKE